MRVILCRRPGTHFRRRAEGSTPLVASPRTKYTAIQSLNDSKRIPARGNRLAKRVTAVDKLWADVSDGWREVTRAHARVATGAPTVGEGCLEITGTVGSTTLTFVIKLQASGWPGLPLQRSCRGPNGFAHPIEMSMV